MNFLNLIPGKIQIKVVSAEISSFLNEISRNSIHLYEVQIENEITIYFWIKSRDFDMLKFICTNRGDKYIVSPKKGINLKLKNIFCRPILFLGICILMFLHTYLPTKILFVTVDGNTNMSSERIIAAGEICGIHFGASRKMVRSEKVKNELLSLLPELQWAGVNTRGCIAVISVAERTDNKEHENVYTSSIVAARDGIIRSCEIEKGNLLCSVGEAVSKGQLLISGLTDYNVMIHNSQAAGEIFAQTVHRIDVITPSECSGKTRSEAIKRKLDMLIGKKRINLWKDSGICYGTCDRMYKEYYIKLPGGFQIPIGFSVDSYTSYQSNPLKLNLDMMSARLTKYSHEYLQQQMISGSIDDSLQSIDISDRTVCMTGEYNCTEMISRIKPQQNGE